MSFFVAFVFVLLPFSALQVRPEVYFDEAMTQVMQD